jgi:SAM-dependent methyltransferase
MTKIVPYALIGIVGLAIAGFLRQRRQPIPTPPRLTSLFENPLVEAFAGPELLVERLGLAPGILVLDAGCGPGRLTIPVAKAVEPSGEVVALDCQRKMLELLQHRLEAESIINLRTLEAGLGEGALPRDAFDRVLLAFVLGEVRDREAAGRELYAALKPGGFLSVTEGFGDPDYRRPASVRREVEPAGFELVERYGGFPVYTLNFRRPERLATHKTSPEASASGDHEWAIPELR